MDNNKKDIQWFKAMSIFEGACFFVAGICALVADNAVGYIAGFLLVVFACMNFWTVIVGGDKQISVMGESFACDDDMDTYGEKLEEAKNDENA